MISKSEKKRRVVNVENAPPNTFVRITEARAHRIPNADRAYRIAPVGLDQVTRCGKPLKPHTPNR